MANETPVDRLYQDAVDVISILKEKTEISLQLAAADNYRKVLLLAAASHYEYRISNTILEFIKHKTSGSILVEQFVRNKAISRQFHTYFSWNESNANQFFGLFGNEFKSMMQEKIKKDNELDTSIKSFIDIGRERNRLVHQDFASFPMEKTMEEIYVLFKSGMLFVEELYKALCECDKNIIEHIGSELTIET